MSNQIIEMNKNDSFTKKGFKNNDSFHNKNYIKPLKYLIWDHGNEQEWFIDYKDLFKITN